MKDFLKKINRKSIAAFFNRKKFKYGGYSAALTAIVIALVGLLNFGLTTLDGYYDLKIDLSQNQTYSVSSQSRQVLEKLDEDITIYTLYPVNGEDPIIREAVSKYKSYSDHVKIVNVDPNKNPTFVNKYNTENTSISAGSIIVTNADESKFRILDQYDLYQIGYDSSTGQSYADQVIVESSLTSAILFLTSDKVQRVLFLTGHAEPAQYYSQDLRDNLKDLNYDVLDYEILTTDEAIQPGDIIVALAPQTDLNEEEREILKAYINEGGRFLFAFDPQYGVLSNFQSLLSLYGITLEPGIVIEGDRDYYSIPYAYYLLPELMSHDATAAAKNSKLDLFAPLAGAVTKPVDPPYANITIQPLLTTSESAWLEADVANADLNKDEGAKTGPFDLALAVTKEDPSDSAKNVQFIIMNCSNSVQYAGSQEFSRFSNEDFVNGCMQWLSGQTETVYVRGKLLDSPVLYFQSAAQIYTVIILVWPVLSLLIFAAGIVIYLRRKHL